MKKFDVQHGITFLKTAILSSSFLIFMSCDAVYEASNSGNTVNYPAGNQTNQVFYGGNYTNQGDPDRSGTFTMQLAQNASEISGTARYSTALGEDSGLLSVVGNVNNGVAKVQFLNQNGNAVANGVISPNQGNYSFVQNGSSNWIPMDALMFKN